MHSQRPGFQAGSSRYSPARRQLATYALTFLVLSAHTCCAARRAHSQLRETREAAELPLKVFTVSTKETAGGEMITNLLESCSPIYNITVLGESGEYFAGHTTKVMLMIKALRELDPDQLVLFLDADLRCFPCTRDLVQLFLTQSADIVMAADYDGYPDFWKEPWFPPVPEGMPPKARQYVNSGTYIGRAHSIQAVLVKYMLNHGQHLQQKELHDQRLFQDVFLAQYYNPGPSDDPSIALDYGGYYFQTFDNRDTCWQQQLPTKQVWCTDIYLAEACILHTAGAKRHFYDTLIPRWKANETNIHPDPKPVKA